MIHWLTIAWQTYILHTMHGNGYQWWSGSGSDIGEVTLIGAVLGSTALAYRRHECHIESCHWPAWHAHPDHGHPVCRKHHPSRVTDQGIEVKQDGQEKG